MGFFGSKNKDKNNVPDAEVQEKVEREVIVHNMPSQERIKGLLTSPEKEINFNLSSDLGPQANTKKDFKMMGVLIISAGLVVIALIVFLTYRFVIAPTVDPKEPEVKIETAQGIIPNEESENLTEVEVPINEEPITNIDQEVSDLTIETVKPLDDDKVEPSDTMQEEFQGQDAVNLSPLIDSDSDGLYDEEEILLGTSIFLSDSDGDTYPDLSEINNNYNPSGEGSLVDSDSISLYRNFNYNFNFLYPNAWELKEPSDELIVFEDRDNSLVQLAIMENTDKLSILNWYEATFPEDALAYDKLISKSGYEGVISKSGLNVYLTDEARSTIFVFSYIPASSERLTFINIFEMIYSSFSF